MSILYLGPVLRRLRESARLGTGELAERSGVAHRRVEAIEAGAKDATLLEVAALAHELGYTVDEIRAALIADVFLDAASVSGHGERAHDD